MTLTTTHDRRARSARTARLEARITAEQKALLLRAAALTGRSVSDFVVSSAHDAAARTVREHEVMTLNARDSRRFVDVLLNPPRPSARLRKAARRHRQIVAAADAR